MPKDDHMSEADAFLAANPDVKTIELLMPDMCGVLRGKRLTQNSFRKLYSGAVRTPGSLYILDITGQDVPIVLTGVAGGDPDKFCQPAPGTLKPVPWAAQPLGQVLGSMTEDDGAPLYSDPRAILASVMTCGRWARRPLNEAHCDLAFAAQRMAVRPFRRPSLPTGQYHPRSLPPTV